MATFDVFNMKREKVGSIDLADEVFGTEVREHLFYEVVKAQLASKRQGTQSAKNRSAVSGSTKKIYEQKGTGRARHGSIRAPLFVGGGQERGMRSGTLNVPGIVALGKAAELAVAERQEEAKRLRLLRERLHRGIVETVPDVRLNGSALPALDADGGIAGGADDLRLPGNLNLSFAGVDGEALLLGMKDVAVSSGSACTSASLEPSHVLQAIGVPDDDAHASIRFGLGRFTTAEEIDFAIATTAAAVRRLRELAPVVSAAAPGPAAGA